MKTFSTPILFIIFNRPDTTAVVFEAIRARKPAKLFIAADGPRKDRDGEKEKCELTREIVSQVDWECEVKTLYREHNLGCKEAVSSAITWFFDHVEEGIILEDDCLPHPDFFPFMEEMLERYRANEKVSMISGYNIAGTWKTPASYLFSKYSAIWGWATWKRAWKKYDGTMQDWRDPKVRDALSKIIGDRKQWKIKSWIYEQAFRGHKNSWAYPWEYSSIKNGSLSVVPHVNLIKNIGFGVSATHTQTNTTATTGAEHPLSVTTGPISFPLTHPPEIRADDSYDNFFIKRAFDNQDTSMKIFKKIKRVQKKIREHIQLHKLSAPIRAARSTPRFTASVVPIDGIPFNIIDSASFISAYREIFLSGIYRFKTTSSTPHIIDCGANVGVSLLYFKKHYPEATIEAFEPDPVIFKVLEKNVAAFHMTNVKLHQSAVWNSTGTATFASDGADGGRLEEDSNSTGSATSPTAVPTVRLRDFLDRDVDLLKIDIEGAEDVVMQDIGNNLSRVKNIFLEYHSPAKKSQDLDEILRLLKKAGFRYYIKDVGVESHSPFISVTSKQGFDNQLNIFAYRP